MTRDPKRARLAALLRENDLSLARASAAIGRNTTYLQQYLGRGMPKVLASQDTEALGRLLGCDPSELQHEARPAPAPMAQQKRTRRRLPAVVAVPEITLNRHTDPDTIVGAPDPQEASWRIPGRLPRRCTGTRTNSSRRRGTCTWLPLRTSSRSMRGCTGAPRLEPDSDCSVTVSCSGLNPCQ